MKTVHAARPYQTALIAAIYAAWSFLTPAPDVSPLPATPPLVTKAPAQRNVLAVLPTGGGKTFIFSSMIANLQGAACAVAHRKELVAQMSVALAREGVRHRVIGSDTARKACVRAHLKEFGRSFIDPNASVAVAGVDTLIKADATLKEWLLRVQLWVMDEAHHVLRENKWGKAIALMPNAWGLGVTATPCRADGQGLGAHADGVFHQMVSGPGMRELIDAGYLCDYYVVCPPSDIDLAQARISADGDFNKDDVKAARRKSHITGDVVKNYLKFARGKRGITFDTDVTSATETAQAFRDAGVRAEVVSGDTPADLRDAIIQKFRDGHLEQLVNVDLFGEGFDVPAVEVVSFARPTMSFALFAQQWGRALRTMAGKARAIIIDHVGNLVRHNGPPDKPRVHTLDRREKRSRSIIEEVPLRSCLECFRPYERTFYACPSCGAEPVPVSRSAPEFVDGDLVLISDEAMAKLRANVIDVAVAPPAYPSQPGPVQAHLRNAFWEKQQAQIALRQTMALWNGWQLSVHGLDQRAAQRKFYLLFGVDTLGAQALAPADAAALQQRITVLLERNRVAAA